MYLDNAVITTSAGGAEQVITHRENGLLVDYENIDKLSNSFALLYNNAELRKNLAEKGRKFVKQFCSLEDMKAEIINFCSWNEYSIY